MPKLKVTEAFIQRAVVETLQWDGWRAIRTDPVSDRARGKGFGEVGMPDYLFVRYQFPCKGDGCSGEHCGTPDCVEGEVLWIEFKRPGQKPRPAQIAWHEAERRRGALVLVVDSIYEFRDWYAASGLKRR